MPPAFAHLRVEDLLFFPLCGIVQKRAYLASSIHRDHYCCRQSIFQPFFRVDKSLSRELGGAGLALPLVWEIARLHGGRVWVEESNDNGSALAVTLPLSASITDTVRR